MGDLSQIGANKSTIYLVRHGESAANVAQINLPPHEDVLTETGKCQADLLGKHLKDVVFTKAYASTYARAHDTAKAVLANSNMTDKPELKIDARIRERELGDFVGKPAKFAFKELYTAVQQGTSVVKFEIPGAETVNDFDGRIDSFLEDLFKELKESSKPETVLVVSHGLTILRMMSKLKEPHRNLSLQSFTFSQACRPMKNTNYHVFTVETPAKDCTDGQICMEFLKFHEKDHLESLDKTAVDHGGPIASAFTKLAEQDGSIFSQCAQQ